MRNCETKGSFDLCSTVNGGVLAVYISYEHTSQNISLIEFIRSKLSFLIAHVTM